MHKSRVGRGGLCEEKERLRQEHNLDIFCIFGKFILVQGWYSARHSNMHPATNKIPLKTLRNREKKSTLKTQNYSGMRLIILVTLTGIRLSRSWAFPRAIARFSWQGTLRSWLWTVSSHSCHGLYGHRAKPLMAVRLMHIRHPVYHHC